MISLEVVNGNAIIRGLQTAAAEIIEGVSEAIEDSARALERDVLAATPSKSGRSRGLVKMKMTRALEARVGYYQSGNEPFYIRFLEFGTKPHVIKPKFGSAKAQAAYKKRYGKAVKARRALSFMLGGKNVAAASVNHPGIKPRLTLRNRLVANEDAITKTISAAIREAIQRGGGQIPGVRYR